MESAVSQIQEAYKKRNVNYVQPAAVVDENTNRYLWYPAEDIPSEGAIAGYTYLFKQRARELNMPNANVPSGYIERCRVAPVLAWPVWERAMDVPADMRRDGRTLMPSGDYAEYLYHVPAGHVFATVYEQYRGWGVTELQALRGFDIGEFLKLDVDGKFFPFEKDRSRYNTTGYLVDEIPRDYKLILDQINKVANSLEADGNRDLYLRIAGDMIHAVEVSRAFDTTLVDEEETRQPLRYSNHGLRALSRLGRQRRDHALNAMAARQDEAFSGLSGLPEAIKAMAGNQQPSGFSPDQFSEFASTVAEKIAATMAAQFNKPAAPQQNSQPQNKK